MGGLLGNTKVARRGAGPGSPQCEVANVPVYQCRDYSRGYPRTVVSSLPCHMGPPPGGYHDPYHYPPALPSGSQDLGYGEEAENWSESTLVYFGVGLVTIAILSKFIQDLLRSPSPRASRASSSSSPKKSTIFSAPEERVGAGGEKDPILSMKDLFYGEPETVVILKTDDRKVIDNIHQYKYFGLPPEDSKPAPKAAEPAKSEGKKKQKEEKKEEAKKEEPKKDEAKKEEAKPEEKKEEPKPEEKKEEEAKPEEKKEEEAKPEEKKEEEAKPEEKKEEAPPAEAPKEEEKKEEPPPPPPPRDILLRVPMCCTECELTAADALREMPGVTDVQCDYHEEKVVVTVVGDIQAPDLLLKCRSLKLFRKSEYWK